MHSNELKKVRDFEREKAKNDMKDGRPVFHLTPLTGWMNDPNGFSFYKGQYHLFYQYYPFNTFWGTMHWGHAVSEDLLHWTYLPAALAPDHNYDAHGCFSGTAIAYDDKHLLMYTGVSKSHTHSDKEVQMQCIAIGDGVNYTKHSENPVLDTSSLPPGMSPYDFRDPKIWRSKEGDYFCVVSAKNEHQLGSLLLYRSPDCYTWRYEGILAENDGSLGMMWECPDLFELDGKSILLLSPMEMMPDGSEYGNGGGTVACIGRIDKDAVRFVREHVHTIDYGLDFYAPQTVLASDGRRIMVAWMQNWETYKAVYPKKNKWLGQMTLPRELTLKNGRLYQQPIRELARYRSEKVDYKNVRLSGMQQLEGISGRSAELHVRLRTIPEKWLHCFRICFAAGGKNFSSLTFRPQESLLTLDRSRSGIRAASMHQKDLKIDSWNGVLDLQIILDHYSAEIFVNGGEYVLSCLVQTELSADEIVFEALGDACMDITKYKLF